MAKNWKLFYDGGCNLCHTSKLRVEQWAERRGMPLDVEILQSAEAIEKGYGEAMVLEADGQVYQGAFAWLKLMEIAPWYLRWVGGLSRFRFTRSILVWAYGVVAKYRYKVFGTRACKLPANPPRS